MVDEGKTFKVLWLQTQYKRLKADPSLKDLSPEELKKYLLDIYEKREISYRTFV